MDHTEELPSHQTVLYPDNDKHQAMISHALWRTDRELNDHLNLHSRQEAKKLINRGISVRYAHKPDELRCTTLLNELIREEENLETLAKITTLLQHGCDPNAQYERSANERHPTISNIPLSSAIIRGNITMVETLLRYQADPYQKDIHNQTALESTEKLKRYAILSLLPGSGVPAPPATQQRYEEIEQMIIEHCHRISLSDDSE